MKMTAGDAVWRELVDRLLDAAEERPGGYKKMFFMEKLGFQDHTVSIETNLSPTNFAKLIPRSIFTFNFRLMNTQTNQICGGGNLVLT